MMVKKRRQLVRAVSVFGALLLTVLFAALIWYLHGVKVYRMKVAAIVVETVDISRIPDGSYTGSSDAGMVRARVRVQVEDGKITEIRLLEHKNGRGKPAEKLTEDIIKKQSLQVDAVTGATNSSLVIRKAVENALKKG